MNRTDRKNHIKMLWGKVRKGVRGSMFVQRLHDDKESDVDFLANQKRLAIEDDIAEKAKRHAPWLIDPANSQG